MNFKKIFFLSYPLTFIIFNNSLFADTKNNLPHKKETYDNLYESTSIKTISRKTHYFIISPRLGLDSITDKDGGYFLSGGVDLIWKPAVNNNNIILFPEIGIKYLASINNISNKNINKVRNIYGFIGLEAPTNLNISTSLRFLAGNETVELLNPDRKIDQITVGGELMVGYKLKNGYKLYGTIGFTQHTQLIGINLAIII